MMPNIVIQSQFVTTGIGEIYPIVCSSCLSGSCGQRFEPERGDKMKLKEASVGYERWKDIMQNIFRNETSS